MNHVKITVLRKQMYADFAQTFLTDGVQECDFFEEGDSFLYTGGAEMPPGLCPWAWIDIYHSVSALASGSTCTPWQNRDGVSVVCCTDGIRPVSFLLEALPATP